MLYHTWTVQQKLSARHENRYSETVFCIGCIKINVVPTFVGLFTVVKLHSYSEGRKRKVHGKDIKKWKTRQPNSQTSIDADMLVDGIRRDLVNVPTSQEKKRMKKPFRIEFNKYETGLKPCLKFHRVVRIGSGRSNIIA